MGFFSTLGDAFSAPFKVAGSLLGGGGGGSQNSNISTSTTVNPVTNVTNKIDTEPLAKILAQSNKESASIYAKGMLQSSNNEKEAQQIELINAERDRQLQAAKIQKFDGYLEHAKNGLVISAVAAGLIYAYKKGK